MQLKKYIAEPGRSATQVARDCGVAVSTITRIVNGNKRPSLELMGRIRTATGGAVEPNDFLPLEEREPLCPCAE